MFIRSGLKGNIRSFTGSLLCDIYIYIYTQCIYIYMYLRVYFGI